MYFVFASSLRSDMICPLSSINERETEISEPIAILVEMYICLSVYFFFVAVFNISDIVLLYFLLPFYCI